MWYNNPMKNEFLVSSLITAAVLSGCSSDKDASAERVNPREERVELIHDVAATALNALKCDVKPTFEFSATNQASSGLGSQESAEEVFDATTNSVTDVIVFHEAFLDEELISEDGVEVTVNHEVAHVCGGEEVEMPFHYEIEGIPVKYVQGFRFTAERLEKGVTEEGIHTYVHLEEAYATVFGEDISGTGSNTEYYMEVGERLRAVLTESGVTIEDLAEYHQKSDIAGLLAQLYGVKRAEVGQEHLDSLLVSTYPVDYLTAVGAQ